MTVERHFEKMRQMYEELSDEAKKTAVQVGDRHMSLEKLIDEAEEAYLKLDDKHKANIHVDDMGIMATSGNPEIALSMSPVAFGLAGKK